MLSILKELQWQHGRTQVAVGCGVLAQVAGHIEQSGLHRRGLVVTDHNVRELHAQRVIDSLIHGDFKCEAVALPAGEGSKSPATALYLYDKLAQNQVGRDGFVVAVGGGVVTDVVGFVAATWMRGVASVYCPTTLEADIDAAIGGKAGLNHPTGKNLIGAFHHPKIVLIDPNCLSTLSDRDFRAGLAESIKHAAIASEAFLAWHVDNAERILSRDDAVLVELIDRNVAIKADIVARDEREEIGIREMLNFGHTIGHAIESTRDYEWRHGECIALGMVAACRMSVAAGRLDVEQSKRIIRLIEQFNLPIRFTEPIDADEVWQCMERDKKSRAGKTRFVLLDRIGQTSTEHVPEAYIHDAIASLQE